MDTDRIIDSISNLTLFVDTLHQRITTMQRRLNLQDSMIQLQYQTIEELCKREAERERAAKTL